MTEPVCPYCRMPFAEGGPAKIFCTACGTPHHEDCYRENGGCTVFGCSRAPADDPKLQVSQNDLRSVNMPAQPYTAQYPQPQYAPPQPQYPQPQYPPSSYSGPLGLSQAAAQAPATNAVPPAAPGMQPPPPPGGMYVYQQPPYVPPPMAYASVQKSRIAFILLGIFLGTLGIHNFYAGYTGKAVGQLCLTVLTLGYGGFISWIWAVIEICTISQDSQGIPFN